MAVQANDSNKQVVGTTKYTGVANVIVVAVNPTLGEMKAMGIPAQQEPVYYDAEKDKTRIDFYLFKHQPKISTKVSFWIEGKPRTNKDGNKYEWINKFGTTAWSTSSETPPNYTWFKTDGAQPAMIGEPTLTSFIQAWANVAQDGQCTLDTINKIAKGDVTELKQLVKDLAKSEVGVLLYVNDKGYQSVYTGHFSRATNKDFSYWKKAIEKEYGEVKGDFQNSFILKEYLGSANVITDTPTDIPNPPAGGSEMGIRF